MAIEIQRAVDFNAKIFVMARLLSAHFRPKYARITQDCSILVLHSIEGQLTLSNSVLDSHEKRI